MTDSAVDTAAVLTMIAPATRARLTERFDLELAPETLAGSVGGDPRLVSAAFPDSDALLGALVVKAYNDMSDAAEAAARSVAAASPSDRWNAICAGVREWALAAPADYVLVWGPPVPGFVAPEESMAAGARTVVALVEVVRDALAAGDLSAPPVSAPVPDGLRSTVDVLSAGLLSGLPEAAVVGMVIAWTQLHGMIGFEVNGHIAGIADNPAAFFAHAVHLMGIGLGLASSTVIR